ncbi:MAG: hypothetical protein ACMUEM_05035 [Flavobacteriales bacterium AspAUS03]
MNIQFTVKETLGKSLDHGKNNDVLEFKHTAEDPFIVYGSYKDTSELIIKLIVGGITTFSGTYIINTRILSTEISTVFITGELLWIQPSRLAIPYLMHKILLISLLILLQKS